MPYSVVIRTIRQTGNVGWWKMQHVYNVYNV